MATGLGFNGGKLGFSKETVYGDGAARTNVICINSDGLAVEEEEIVDECLHGDFQDIDGIYKGNSKAGGDVEISMPYEGIELLLENLLGTKVTTETASYVIDATNNKIDFTEDGGSELTASLANSTYILGASSATAGTLCAEIKTALEAAGAGTYTVTYSRTTKKITIAISGGVITAFVLKWNTGTNKLLCPAVMLGWTLAADTVSGASAVAPNTIESVYSHVFTRNATATQQAGLALEKTLDTSLATAKSALYKGCMINSMDFSTEAGGKLMMSMNIIAKEESLLDTETVSALTHEAKPLILASQAAITSTSGVESLVNSFSATLGMVLKDDRYFIGASTIAKPLLNGKLELTGTMELEFTGKEKYDIFRNNTTNLISITFTSPTKIVGLVPYSFTISFPTVKLTGSTPQVKDSGVIVVEIPFKAAGVDTSNKGVVVTMVNGQYLA